MKANNETPQTQTTARLWVDRVVNEYGLKIAIQLMTYNVSGKNPHFKESNDFVTYAWQRFNELNPS